MASQGLPGGVGQLPSVVTCSSTPPEYALLFTSPPHSLTVLPGVTFPISDLHPNSHLRLCFGGNLGQLSIPDPLPHYVRRKGTIIGGHVTNARYWLISQSLLETFLESFHFFIKGTDIFGAGIPPPPSCLDHEQAFRAAAAVLRPEGKAKRITETLVSLMY